MTTPELNATLSAILAAGWLRARYMDKHLSLSTCLNIENTFAEQGKLELLVTSLGEIALQAMEDAHRRGGPDPMAAMSHFLDVVAAGGAQ